MGYSILVYYIWEDRLIHLPDSLIGDTISRDTGNATWKNAAWKNAWA